MNAEVDDLAGVMKEGGYHAVFLAAGAHLPVRTLIQCRGGARILYAAGLLRGLEAGETPALGRRVLVYGGGNTALDAARTAKRLGAEETLIVYRRTREKMPAHDFEIQEAMEEGVQFRWLSTVKSACGNSFTVEKMRLDDSGFAEPTGEFETLEADCLVLALGQDADLGFLKRVEGMAVEDGVVTVDSHMMTGCAGVFAGGDMVPGLRTAAVAVGHGKKAARNIDAYLRGQIYTAAPKHDIATFERMNPRGFEHASRIAQAALDASLRVAAFEEVFAGLEEPDAAFEASRCLSCGNCRECDNCYEICPGDAVRKLGPGQRFKFEYVNCDGCGLCAEECSCGAIEMHPVVQ